MAEISLRTYHEQIEALLEKNRPVDAAEHCRHILQQAPRHVPTYRLLGKALLEQNDLAGATDIFQRVLSADPEDFIAHVGLAIIYKEEGLLDESRWHMERAFEMDPYNNVIQAELKDLYSTNGEGPKRLMLNREALARLHIKGELYQKAVTELRTSLSKYPDRIDLKSLLAEALWRDEQRVDAVEVCLEVLDVLPNCIKANAIIAEVWLITGRIEEAQEYLRKIQPMLLLDQENLGDFDSPAAIAFRTDGAMPLPEQITLERLDEEIAPEVALEETIVGIDELVLDEDFFEEDLSADSPDWLADLQAAADMQEAVAGTEEPSEAASTAELEDFLAAAESAFPADEEESDWFALEDDLAAGETDDYSADIELDIIRTTDDAEATPIPDWLQEVDEESELETTAMDSDAEEEDVDEKEVPTWLAAATLAGIAAMGRDDEDEEELLSDLGESEPVASDETGDDAQIDDDVPDWLQDVEHREPSVDEAWLQGPGDELGTLPEEDGWATWLAGEELEGEGSPMSEQEGMDDLSTPPDDLDDALAWLEGLAAQQGASQEELPSLADADEGDDVGTAYPDWLTGDMDEVPSEITASTGGEEDDDSSPADIPDWLLETVNEGEEDAELSAEMPAEEDMMEDDLSWLDEIAAGGGAALDEPLTLSWEKERSEQEDASEPYPGDVGYDASLSDEAVPADAAQYDEPPEDLDEAMDWLEQLAARQGADLEELPSVGEKPAEPTRSAASETGFPDWLAEVEPAEEEEEEDDRFLAAALGAAAVGAAATRDREEDEDEPESVPAGAKADDITGDFPDDPDDALAWLEDLARQDVISEPDQEEIPEPVEEPITPALPQDVVAAQAAAAAKEAAALQAAAEAESAADVREEPTTDDEWIDQIPDDPDAAMAWLEQLAARQGADLEELPTVDEIPDDVETPDWISKEMAAAAVMLPEVDEEDSAEPPEVEASAEALAEAELEEPIEAALEEPAETVLEEPAEATLEEPAEAELEEPVSEEPAPVVPESEEPVTAPEMEDDWQLDMEGEIAEAMPDWLSMDLVDVSPELPEEEIEDWEEAHADVTSWLVAEEEVRAAEAKQPAEFEQASDPKLWTQPEMESTPQTEPAPEPAGEVAPPLQKAREAISLGNVANALETYQSLLAEGEHLDSLIQELENTQVEKEHQPQVNRLLGDAYMKNGDLQKALEIYQNALGML